MFIVFTKAHLKNLLNLTFFLALTMIFKATEERESLSVLNATMACAPYITFSGVGSLVSGFICLEEPILDKIQ